MLGEAVSLVVLSLAIFWPCNYTEGKCGRTDELLRTMSYQPGIRMPLFCNPFISPILLLAVKGEGRGGTYDGNGDCRRVGEDKLHFLELLSPAPVLC